MFRTLRRLPLAPIFALTLGWTVPAAADSFNLRQALTNSGYKATQGKKTGAQRVPPRARAQMIRAGIQTHRTLVTKKAPITLPKSNIIADKAAAQKRYADSWTCRESSKLLIQQLGQKKVKLTLESSGKNAFKWGNEGLVSYHYYAVDDPKRPTVLLDPTAASNFQRDAQPGGLLHGLLAEAGRSLGQPKAAERVARRIAKGGFNGLLVLGNEAEISVYKDALERAAKKRAEVTRNAERATPQSAP